MDIIVFSRINNDRSLNLLIWVTSRFSRLISILLSMPLRYNPFELNEIENSEEYRLAGWYRSDKTKVEVELVNTYSCILSKTCPRYGYRSGHLHLFRNVRGTPDNCRACVLVLAAMQNVLTHEKRCWLLCTNIEFIMYPICISVGTTLMRGGCSAQVEIFKNDLRQ